MNETIFTEICTKHGFRVEKELAVWTGGGDWYVAYICKNTKEVDIEGLEKSCVELNVKIKEIFKQIKLKEINSDF